MLRELPHCFVGAGSLLTVPFSIKSLVPSQDLAKEHYEDLSARPFYAGLVKYITSGTPVVAM